jgi:succinate dehydrogenase / fumarate reductase, membrane anchor subunit
MVGHDKSGLRDWIAQRVTAVVLAFYFAYILIEIFLHSQASFVYWHDLFSTLWLKVFTFVAVLSVVWHAWVGLWTVLTDYVKPVAVRRLLEVLICLSIITYIIWSAWLLWLI